MRKFLNRLAAAKSDLSVETASFSEETPTSAQLSLKKVRKAVRLMRVSNEPSDPMFQTLDVNLVGLNLRTRTFEVSALADDVSYTGTVAAEVFSEVSKAELPSPYRVVLQVLGTRRRRMISATRI